MWGAAKHERATGIHRPLRATVAIFEPLSGDGRQILLALDHCLLGAAEHRQLVERMAKVSGQAVDDILVVFSHTHGAGLMGLDRVSNPGGDLIPGYLDSIADTAGILVWQAFEQWQPATIVYGQGRCALAANRDFWDGAQYICGYNPGAPADDTVLVAKITSDSGELLATLVNYACHPTTLAWENTLISPDYIGAMRELVERETGGVPCLFLQGASGELGPREGFVGDPAVADRNGRELGYAALSALESLPKPGTQFVYQGAIISGATLGAWKHEPLVTDKSGWRRERWQEPLPYRPNQPTLEETDRELATLQAQETEARQAGDEARAADLRALVERKNRFRYRLLQLPAGDTYPWRVTAWKMGDAWWIGVQGESYNILQTELRRRFPNHAIVVASIADDWGPSYLPPREAYGTGVYPETIAAVAPGALETLIDAIALRLKES